MRKEIVKVNNICVHYAKINANRIFTCIRSKSICFTLFKK